jgi:hypothetical protein
VCFSLGCTTSALETPTGFYSIGGAARTDTDREFPGVPVRPSKSRSAAVHANPPQAETSELTRVPQGRAVAPLAEFACTPRPPRAAWEQLSLLAPPLTRAGRKETSGGMKNGAGEGTHVELVGDGVLLVPRGGDGDAGLRALPQPRERVVRRQPRVPVERQVTRLRGQNRIRGLSLNERDPGEEFHRPRTLVCGSTGVTRVQRGRTLPSATQVSQCSPASQFRSSAHVCPACRADAAPEHSKSTAAARRGARRRRYDACLPIFPIRRSYLEETGAARRTS